MDDFNNSVLEYASTQFGATTEKPAETEMETAPAETTPNTTDQGAEMAADTTNVEAAASTTPIVPEQSTITEPDYNKWLEEQSGGVLKDVDLFKSILPKVTEYDSLLTQKAELEQKLSVNPFHNEFVSKLNEFYKTGANEDQIKNFIKVSSIDLDKLSPVELKVAAMVKEGYNEDIARQIVERDYPIDSFEEGDAERAIIEEKLRVSSKADYESLKQWKADASKVDNSQAELLAQQQEQQRLQTIAQESQYQQQVEQVAPKIAEVLTGIGELTIKPGKEGEYEAMKMQFDYNDDFKSKVPDMVSNYFLDTKAPINEESYAECKEYINAHYLATNIESIIQANTRHVEAITWEKAVNKYENRSGLPAETTNVNVDNSQAEYSNFLSRVANGK